MGDEDSIPVRGVPYEPVDKLLLVPRIEWHGDLAIAISPRCNTILELNLSHDKRPYNYHNNVRGALKEDGSLGERSP